MLRYAWSSMKEYINWKAELFGCSRKQIAWKAELERSLGLFFTLSVMKTSETAFFAVLSLSSRSLVLHLSIQSTLEGCFFFHRLWVSSGLKSLSCLRGPRGPSSPPSSLLDSKCDGEPKPSLSELKNEGEMPTPEPRARGTPRPLQQSRKWL